MARFCSFNPNWRRLFADEKVGDSIVVINGVPERILGMCDYYVQDGKSHKITQEAIARVKGLNKGLEDM